MNFARKQRQFDNQLPAAPRITDEQIEARADELEHELMRDGFITFKSGAFHVEQQTIADDLLPLINDQITQGDWEDLSNELLLALAQNKAAPVIRKMRALVKQAARKLAEKAAEKDLGV